MPLLNRNAFFAFALTLLFNTNIRNAHGWVSPTIQMPSSQQHNNQETSSTTTTPPPQPPYKVSARTTSNYSHEISMSTDIKSNYVPQHTHILILPGFGTESHDYTSDNSLVPNLVRRGWNNDNIHVLPMERYDWGRVMIGGISDINFWKGQAAPTQDAYYWYLERVAQEVQRINMKVQKEHEGCKAKIILMGHSAGGWLARAAVGYGVENFQKAQCDTQVLNCGKNNNTNDFQIDIDTILGIVTLGSPHLPSPIGKIDITGGALRMTNEKFPGAYFSNKMFYVTAAGSGVDGNEPKSFMATKLNEIAYESYKLVCGTGKCNGDGVVPVEAAHLDGAIQLNIDNVFHAAQLSSTSWYGSDSIIDEWFDSVQFVLMEQHNNMMAFV